MMKHPYVYALLTALLLIGCSSPEDSTSDASSGMEVPEGWIYYRVANPSYDLTAPVGWELDTTGKMNTSMILFTPADSTNDYFKENINLILDDVSANNLSIDAYVEQAVGMIREFITDLEQLEVKKEGEDYWLTYLGRQGTLKASYYQRIMVKDGRAYILTYTSIDGKPSKSHALAQEVIRRFQLR